jgi:hypothetical protein
MTKLETFASITKPQDRLLSHGFCSALHFGLQLKNSPAADSVYKASVRAVKRTLLTGVTMHKQHEHGYLLKLGLDAEDRLMTAALEYSPPENPKVHLSSELTGTLGSSDSFSASVSTEVTVDGLRAKVGVMTGPKFKITGVAGETAAGVGWDLDYDALAGRFSGYNGLVYLSHSHSRVALRHTSDNALAYRLGKLELSYFTQVAENTEVAAGLSMVPRVSQSLLEVGLRHKFSEHLVGKVKLNDRGTVETSFKHRLNDNAVLTTSSSVSFRGLPSYNLGFSLSLRN